MLSISLYCGFSSLSGLSLRIKAWRFPLSMVHALQERHRLSVWALLTSSLPCFLFANLGMLYCRCRTLYSGVRLVTVWYPVVGVVHLTTVPICILFWVKENSCRLLSTCKNYSSTDKWHLLFELIYWYIQWRGMTPCGGLWPSTLCSVSLAGFSHGYGRHHCQKSTTLLVSFWYGSSNFGDFRFVSATVTKKEVVQLPLFKQFHCICAIAELSTCLVCFSSIPAY